jgi:excisionase family DNA binding protein
MINTTVIQLEPEELKEMIKQAVVEALATMPQPQNKPAEIPPITTKELCKFLNITTPTVIRWRKKGKIPFINIGSAIRFNLTDVMSALEKK